MFSDNTRLTKANAVAPMDSWLGTELHKTKNVLCAVYDFAVAGGAVGDIALVDDQGNPAVLPNKAVVSRVLIDVVTPATSGGSATVAGKSASAADLLAATAVASITGLLDGKPVNTAATSVKMTADTTVKITVAVAALTAGKFRMFIEYCIGG